MLVDLSHVSDDTMRDALDASNAPVIFSHSSARALDDHPRNVPDDILRLTAANGGVVMVNFYTGHLSERCPPVERRARRRRSAAEVAVRRPARKARGGVTAWERHTPRRLATVALVADHVEHVAKIAGHDHVGIGGDLDGIEVAPAGMSSVAGYPLLFAELIRRGWSDSDLAKLAGGNLLRVMRQAESGVGVDEERAALDGARRWGPSQ